MQKSIPAQISQLMGYKATGDAFENGAGGRVDNVGKIRGNMELGIGEYEALWKSGF